MERQMVEDLKLCKVTRPSYNLFYYVSFLNKNPEAFRKSKQFMQIYHAFILIT